MLGLLIVTVFLVGLALVVCWAAVLPEGRAEERTATSATEAAPPFAAAAEHSLEGALFAELLRHEITPAQYRRAIEALVAREDERYPLRVPPEAGSDAGKL